MARVAVGGLQHETNTFAPHKADLAAFREVAAFPRLPRREEIFAAMAGKNLPLQGFIETAQEAGHTLVPTIWGTAVPSAHVTDEAFEHIAGVLIEELEQAGKVDAVYLCLHGAMVTESFEDGEGELLRRVRAMVGKETPLVASLDLHSNTTAAMVELSDALVAYRTYPHVDMAKTGSRAAGLLQRIFDTGDRPAKALRRPDFLIPLVWQCSLIPPASELYAGFDAMEAGGDVCLSFTPGFPPADIAECGPSVLAYGQTQSVADQAADAIARQVEANRANWAGELLSPMAAIQRANRGYRGRPFIFADTQDNPGAGGAGDTTGILAALVQANVDDAVVACIYDPVAAQAAHAAGAGAELTLPLGGNSRYPGVEPFRGKFKVHALSDGRFCGTGAMTGGASYQLGPTAVLRIGGVDTIVISARTQTLDQAILRHIGVEPARRKIVALKSSVHFRADFQEMAEEVFVVVAPGANFADHRSVTYNNLRCGLDIAP